MEKDITIVKKKTKVAVNNQKLSSWFIGLGIVLFVWHNPYQPLLQYAFLPWIGTIILIVACVITLTAKTYKLDLGEKKIWIPLAIIAVSIAMSGILNNNWQAGISTSIMLACIYLTSRVLGNKIFQTIAPYVVIIESVSIIIWGMTHNWSLNGGLLSPSNYDIATGLVIFFVLLAKKEHQWWLATIATVGLIFSGSAEAILVGTILFVIVIIRKLFKKIDIQWWKILSPVFALMLIGLITIPTGMFVQFQGAQMQRLSWFEDITGWSWLPNIDTSQLIEQGYKGDINDVLGQRFTHFNLSPIKPFGYGINLTHFYYGIPHNLILIIIEQVGIVAMLAWLAVAFQGIRNRKWRYVWIGFCLMGLVDHFIFTQAAPWFWVLAGITFMRDKIDDNDIRLKT